MENRKEIVLRTLNSERAERVPCAPHWWGVYKYELPGHDYLTDAWTEGERLWRVYTDFFETFKPDWFHLHIGTPAWFKGSEILTRDGTPYLIVDERMRPLKSADRYFSAGSAEDEKIVDFPDYLLGSRCSRGRVDLTSRRKIDEYIKRFVHLDADMIVELGYTDHVPPIAEAYGDRVFINVHIPSAVCEIFDPHTGYVGFEKGLLAFHDQPAGMGYLIRRCYEEQLQWARAFASAGAHGFCISESYLSPDIAGPRLYRDYLKPVHREYFGEIARLGLTPLCNFWGDVNPLIDDLADIGIKGLMVEESKKSFTVEMCELLARAEDRVCLFGNLDSLSLLHDGTPEEIRSEVLRQMSCSRGEFIAANGSPITPGTPSENVHALSDAARAVRLD
jgi:hypothetical protein